MDTEKKFKFGDVVVNHRCKDQKIRQGVFVRATAGLVELTNTTGRFWTVPNDSNSQLEKIGSIFDID
jgi:hypothetical protein